jgi:mono/diheme cytochrome c family protein
VKVRRVLRLGLLAMLGAFVLIQVIPLGRDHSNPPTTAEPRWDSSQTRALAAAACFDCHSNETEWPWYTNVAPFSWLTQSDVDRGRETLNFSQWDRAQGEAHEATETIREGTMPPWYYRLLHAGARLTDAQKQELIRGLEATFRASPPLDGEHTEE